MTTEEAERWIVEHACPPPDADWTEELELLAGAEGPYAYVCALRRRLAEAELVRRLEPAHAGGDGVAQELARLREEVAQLRRSLPAAVGSAEQAAALAGVSVRTIRRRIRAGELPTRKLGRRTLVDLSALRPLEEAEVIRLAREARNGRNGEGR